MAKRKKGLFIQIWSDDNNAYIFNSRESALSNAKEMLNDTNNVEIGTSVRIYDLTNIKPITNLKSQIVLN